MKRLAFTAAVVAQLCAGASFGHAQDAPEIPLDPSPLTAAPVVPVKKPADATESFDANANQQLQTISKNTGDTYIRLNDLFKSSGLVQRVLGDVRKVGEDTQTTLDTALTGVKTVPMNNDPEDVAARAGYENLRKLAVQLMQGTPPAGQAASLVIPDIEAVYNLRAIFDKKDDLKFEEWVHGNLAGHGLAGIAISETANAGVNASMARLDGYIQALAASPDLKTSIDLNTRVLIELTQQTNENVRVNAIQANMFANYVFSLASNYSDESTINDLLNVNRD